MSEWILDHRCTPHNALDAPSSLTLVLRRGSGLCCLKRGMSVAASWINAPQCKMRVVEWSPGTIKYALVSDFAWM